MTKGRASSKAAELDAYVGARVREQRISLGLTQQQLAAMIGVTYQQAHKYERGINRISSGRLFEVARVLGVPVTYFYDGIAGGASPEPPHQRMMLEFNRNFSRIKDDKLQEAIAQLVRALANT